jgi:hypothetical protein|uniref:Uncharacterized protein n=1 Tax=Myoviridae sp. ctA4D8 TaxID=2823535 RepID=A0A8S5L6H9_9CAUD|nr:MAG TPA: hypothetical protein [Myoviridae sp. ctA4D8]
MNNFKYIPKGRDIAITMDGEILIDSDPKIQALVTLINGKDPEILSYNTRGRIAIEMQNALYDAIDKYSIRELAKNHIENLLKENPKIKTDDREREKALRDIKSGVLAPYSEELEKQLKEILENNMVNEANITGGVRVDPDKIYMLHDKGYSGVMVYFGSTNKNYVQIKDFNAEEHAKIHMYTSMNPEYKRMFLNAIPDLINETILDFVEMNERAGRSKFYEKYGDKIIKNRLNEENGKDEFGGYDITLTYKNRSGEFGIRIGDLVDYSVRASAEEEAVLLKADKDAFAKTLHKYIYNYVYTYFKDICVRNNSSKLVKEYVDFVIKGSGRVGGSLDRFFHDMLSGLETNNTDLLYAYKDEIRAEVEKRGIVLNESADNTQTKYVRSRYRPYINMYVPKGEDIISITLDGYGTFIYKADEKERANADLLDHSDVHFELDLTEKIQQVLYNVLISIPDLPGVDMKSILKDYVKDMYDTWKKDEVYMKNFVDMLELSDLAYYKDDIMAELSKLGYLYESRRIRYVNEARFDKEIKTDHGLVFVKNKHDGTYTFGLVGGFNSDYELSPREKASFFLLLRNRKLSATVVEQINKQLKNFIQEYIQNIGSMFQVDKVIKNHVNFLINQNKYSDIVEVARPFVDSYYGDIYKKEFIKKGVLLS